METKETELVQLIRQLKDYVILDKKDYEKLVQNSKPSECNESAYVYEGNNRLYE